MALLERSTPKDATRGAWRATGGIVSLSRHEPVDEIGVLLVLVAIGGCLMALWAWWRG